MKRKNLFPLNKIPYLKNKAYREKNCIFCKILENSEEVTGLVIHHGRHASITLNLYPYNPGHLMIFPHRHVIDIRDLNFDEEQEILILTKASLDMIEGEYGTGSFNLGYNLGKDSGASIDHIHLHIVPRYPNETGFIDIIAGAKLIVEDPKKTHMRLKEKIPAYLKKYLNS